MKKLGMRIFKLKGKRRAESIANSGFNSNVSVLFLTFDECPYSTIVM